MTPEALGVLFIGTLWVVSMAVMGALVLRGKAPWQARAHVSETPDEDPRTDEESEVDTVDSLVLNGQRVSKGKRRSR